MLETHVVTYDFDDNEKQRMVIVREGMTSRVRITIKQPDSVEVVTVECDGYELLSAIKAVL